METIQFKDRLSTYPNRRKLKIVSQVGNEMVADVEFADEPTQQGTPINAETMNKWQQTIVENESKANNAVSTSNTANTTANTAKTKAETAISTANSAVTTANEAKTIAQDANNRVLSGLGTKVSSGGSEQLTWNSDTKVDKNQGTTNAKKTLTIGDDGNVTPSNYIYIGNIKVYQDSDGLAFEFPDEA